MDYEKIHKDTLAKLQEMTNSGKITVETARSICADFIPESEDERIRKLLIVLFKNDYDNNPNARFAGIKVKNIIAWLEKEELKKSDEEDVNGEDYGIDSLYHAQRILEKTLGKVDGYQSDDGILEHKCAISAVKKLYEQNYSWSEEDESMYTRTLGILGKCYMGELPTKVEEELKWFKSLKERYAWKPTDEQMLAVNTAINVIGKGTINGKYLVELHEQLKKLRGE